MAFSWHYEAFSTITFDEPESETLKDRNNSKDIFFYKFEIHRWQFEALGSLLNSPWKMEFLS